MVRVVAGHKPNCEISVLWKYFHIKAFRKTFLNCSSICFQGKRIILQDVCCRNIQHQNRALWIYAIQFACIDENVLVSICKLSPNFFPLFLAYFANFLHFCRIKFIWSLARQENANDSWKNAANHS